MRYPMFADDVVSATDLTRNTSEVLDQALKAPVTISRKSEQFALLSRKTASRLTRTLEAATITLEYLERILPGRPADRAGGSRHHWLRAFERDDLDRFRDELTEVASRVLGGEADPSEVEDLIHEWRESGLAIQSGVLAEMVNEPSGEGLRISRPGEEQAL